MPFDRVYTSPRIRARETAVLAGLYDARVMDDLGEWDYGGYEGLTTAEILLQRPNWDLFTDGCPGGESPLDIDRRADRVLLALTPVDSAGARIVIVAHGHFLRVLAARWLGFDAFFARYLHLDTASVSVLSAEHDTHVIRAWNT
jgi:probable phosphoglycerate mutase